ncbi:MAG: LamG-like jellyroll fold domain-containing protein, partial [Promethearchaeota archaeon]
MNSSDQIEGNIDGSLDFDGADDGASLPGVVIGDRAAWTISAWIRMGADTADQRTIYSEGNTGVDEYLFLYVDDTNSEVRFYSVTATGDWAQVIGSTNVENNQWHLVTMVQRSKTDRELYVGSSSEGTSTQDSGTFSTDTASIGVLDYLWGPADWFYGTIDEVRISHVARSSGWIATEFENQNDPPSFISIGQEKLMRADQPTHLRFSTSSHSPVTLDVNVELKVVSNVDSLDNSLSPGTSFSVDNASMTTWTAIVPVTPPEGVEGVGFSIDYPRRDWGPVSVANPSGVTKTAPDDWVAQSGTLTLSTAAVDEYGMWKVEFLQDTSILDLKLGPSGGPLQDTASFSVNDEMEFLVTIPQLDEESTTFVLMDPSGAVWYSATNTTSGVSVHEIPSFRYRKDFVIDHTQVDGNLVDFPVFIDISDSDLRNTDKVQADGDDILFVSNGVVLAHEMEIFDQVYNSTHARLVAWVKANLSSTVDTTITMYYGNPVVGSQENPSEVWASGFVGVWHLDESLSGAEGEILDSTSNDNDGYSRGSMDSLDSIDSKLGRGFELDGIDDFLVVPDSISLDSVADRGTIETWINWVDSSDGRYQRIMVSSNRFRWPSSTHNDGFEWGVQPDGDNFFYPWGGDQPNFNLVANPFINGIWHQVTVTLDYSLGNVKIYLDGNPLTWTTEDVPTYWMQLASLDDWFWGGTTEPYHRGDQCMAGMLDEIRVSEVVRSAAWIATEYNNQNNPNGFYTVGSETAKPTSEASIRKIVDSTADQGIWTVSACYNATGPIADYATSLYQRQFIVRHNSALTLTAPTDAIGDGLSVRVAGALVLVEVDLTDVIDSDPIIGATVNVNWTDEGNPTQVQLDDYGTGIYGKALNTSDLQTLGRWRVKIDSYHPFFDNATLSFNLDILHTTAIEYASPPAASYGDDFVFDITVLDGFDGTPISGATITSNGTIEGITDHGDGTYSVTLDSSGLGIGSHYFELYADPVESYLLESSTTVCLT